MKMGYSDVLVGIQYGDEGKAKVIDLLAEHYDIIVRFNGGMNAGHTLYVDGERLALRQLPSGVLHDHCSVYIGSGCVLNLVELVNEIKKVEALGISLKDRLKISGKTVIIQPHHIALDKKYGGHVGTTKNGIGPCYADRATRALNDKVLPIKLLGIGLVQCREKNIMRPELLKS